MYKVYRAPLTVLLGVVCFVFWMWLYPQALSYQEQNQLFLFTWDYLRERMSVPGGLADYMSEFLVQFFFLRALGAAVMALLLVGLQLLTWSIAKIMGSKPVRGGYLLSFIPSLLVLIYMGDVEVLVSFVVALLLSVLVSPLFIRGGWHRLWLVPLVWHLIGPLVIVPVLLSVLRNRKVGDWVVLLYTFLVFFVGYRLLCAQYPPRDAFFGLNYYRLVETLPPLQVAIPFVTVLCVMLCSVEYSLPSFAGPVLAFLIAGGTVLGVKSAYDKDTYETLAYDYLIRHNRYEDVVKRARKYQPCNEVSACSVNFSLFMTGGLLSRMDAFYQCGTEGIVLPSVRDNLSDISSAELLWLMGMPNITLQYYFDTQESIQNGRKSGRFLSRMAECNIVNGWWGPAKKYLEILQGSLFYRKWAREKMALVGNDALVNLDPVYGYIRQVRFKEDFITVYDSLDLMMAILYNQNKNNFMAGEYYTAWTRLKQREGEK